MQRKPSGQFSGAARSSHRHSGDYRGRASFGANNDNTAGVTQVPAAFQNGQARSNGIMAGPQQFDMARSPPSTASKNTKHVPCKFFKQGACQAGAACPFLHSTDATIETAPCKYFAKGNCKFGAKCALAHILPDGRRVNRPNGAMSMALNGGGLNIGGRVNPPTYQHQDSALANSLLSQQQYPVDPFSGQYQHPQDELSFAQEYDGRYAPFPGEAGLTSNPGSKYGSPINESQLPISGVERRLTALDAPLPASFDSNGISHIARYGAVAASVPSKFGMESPPASLSQRITAQPLDAVKALRSSAFPSNLRNSSQLGSSPPVTTEETFTQRKMHSQQNAPRPRLLSASVPRHGPSDDWDDGFPLEEDFLPPNLHDDVLTPREKMRRLSRPEQDLGVFKNTNHGAGLGIPSNNSSKVGSPLGSSPSRFSALFAKQRQESSNNTTTSTGTGPGTGPGFSHVGSPLRESHIHHASDSFPFSAGAGAVAVSGRASSSTRSRSVLAADPSSSPSPFFFSSPPLLDPTTSTTSSNNFGLNMMSSQLQRTHLSAAGRHEVGGELHQSPPGAAARLQLPGQAAVGVGVGGGLRHVSSPTMMMGGGRFDRTLSSPRISSTRIAEEREGEGDLVFSMDDDLSKRNSCLWGGSSKSPVILPLGEVGRNGVVGSVGGAVGGLRERGGDGQKVVSGVVAGGGAAAVVGGNLYAGRA